MSADDFDDAIHEEVSEPEAEGRGVTIDDFVAYMPTHAYIFTPCREIWVGASVNARLPRVPVLDQARPAQARRERQAHHHQRQRPGSIKNRPVEQMTWCPGFPMLIKDRLVVDGGWIERPDVTCFNLYRPPRLKLGDASTGRTVARPCSQDLSRRRRPHHPLAGAPGAAPADKINHALVLGGAQGIGKDTLLEPVKHAVGPWNFQEVSPGQLLGRFNGFVKSVILRVSEARDLGEIDRFSFYDHTKIYTAAPPDVLRVDEKHLREYYVVQLPGLHHHHEPQDRRHLPAGRRPPPLCGLVATHQGGICPRLLEQAVGLVSGRRLRPCRGLSAELDLSDFDAKAPPPKTAAFWDIVGANQRAGGCRAGRRARRPGQSRCGDAGAADRAASVGEAANG